LAQHASEEGHEISWIEAKILQLQANPVHRKHKAPANVPCSDKPLSQPCWEISPIWFPIISRELEWKWLQSRFMLTVLLVLVFANRGGHFKGIILYS